MKAALHHEQVVGEEADAAHANLDTGDAAREIRRRSDSAVQVLDGADPHEEAHRIIRLEAKALELARVRALNQGEVLGGV